MRRVVIAGAGLAGSAAAISAIQCGAAVRMFDPGRLPRHKVCGEFLTPEAAELLERLGVWEAAVARGAVQMDRVRLVFGSKESGARLPEAAYGLSRHAFDMLMRGEAERLGAEWVVERAPARADVLATGRAGGGTGRDRLFGFKAHFAGAASSCVELFFDGPFYVGVNPVENGVTNVCGLGPESLLRGFGFDYDTLMDRPGALRERTRPLRRITDWLSAGPLVYQRGARSVTEKGLLAGDALQFIDPFTGSGMAAALFAGSLAGKWAAEGGEALEYYREVDAVLARQFEISGWLRSLLEWRWSRSVAGWAPPGWLFSITRPQFGSR